MRKIFYYCPDHQTPSGGTRQIYRHVDILNRNGFEAYALHSTRGFRLTWFENDTRTISLNRFQKQFNRHDDFIVLPEDLGEKIQLFPGNKVIFNQNVYYGFASLGLPCPENLPYLDKSVKYILTVSRHNARCLSFAFPGARICRIFNGVDSRRFSFVPLERKRKVISALPRKNPLDNSLMYQVLATRAQQGLNVMKDYRWEFLATKPEREVVEILAESLILVFLSVHEGLPLMPLEAMLSGAIVVARRDGPSSEYLTPSCSFLLNSADPLSAVRTVEEIALCFESPEGRKRLEEMTLKACRNAAQYSLAREERSLVRFWRRALSE